MKGGDFVLKIKKIMATALVFIMILSLVTIPAMAEETAAGTPLEVTYFNADSSKIVIDFSEGVSDSDLEAALTMESDGEPIAFAVKRVNDSTGGQLGTMSGPTEDYTVNKLTVNTNPTYAITLDDGIELGKLYELAISAENLIGENGGRLAEDYAKTFSVELCWAEEFTYDADQTIPWRTFSGTSNKMSIVDGTLKVGKLSSNSSAIANPPKAAEETGTLFGETGMTATDFFSTFKSETYYNTEISVKAEDISAKRGIFIANSSIATTLDITYINGFMGGMLVSAKGAGYLSAFARKDKDKTKQYETNAGFSGSYINQNPGVSSTGSFWNTTDFTDFSFMSTSDRKMKLFAGNDLSAYASYIYSEAVTAGKYGCMHISFVSGQTYYIDYIRVTKVKEYKRANYTMTPADGATDVAISDEIKLTFEKPVDPASLSTDAVEVYVNDDLTNNYTVSVDEADANSVIVKLDEPMAYRSQYKVLPVSVKFTGDATDYMFISSSFETTMPDMEITELDINYVSGKYTAKATIQNNKIEDGIKGIMSVCLYDANGKMLDIAIQEIDVAMGDDATVIDQWDEYEEGEHYAKCYIWDGMATMNTIMSVIFE